MPQLGLFKFWRKNKAMAHMFKTNDIIAYGTEGVCQITGVEEKLVAGKSIEYYVLKPVDGRSSTVYIPTGNQKLLEKMHKLPSKKEVNALIDSIPQIAPNWIKNDHERKLAYGKVLSSGDHTALIMMIKALYLQKKEREASKKHLGMSDDHFMKAAEQRLYDEWQYVLKMGKEELMAYIFARIEKTSAS